MKKLAISTALITLLLVGCAGKVVLPDGTEMPADVYEAEVQANALAAMRDVSHSCSEIFVYLEDAETAEGEGRVAEAASDCYMMQMMALALNRKLSTQGEVADAFAKEDIAEAQASVAKHQAWAGTAKGLGFGYLGYKAIDALASQAGDTYGDVSIKASNSGDSLGGEGGEELAGGGAGAQERNMNIQVGGNGSNASNQSGSSNTQATAEKATSVDNPIVNGGPNNAIVNDADANGNDGSLF